MYAWSSGDRRCPNPAFMMSAGFFGRASATPLLAAAASSTNLSGSIKYRAYSNSASGRLRRFCAAYAATVFSKSALLVNFWSAIMASGERATPRRVERWRRLGARSAAPRQGRRRSAARAMAAKRCVVTL